MRPVNLDHFTSQLPLFVGSHPIHNIQTDQILIYVTERFVFNLKLQSDLLGPANMRSRIPPPPDKLCGVYDCCSLSKTLP